MNNDQYKAESIRTSCEKCSACCTGGGPILRLADAHLVKTGAIASKYLYTVRKGELLFDRDALKMTPVKTDLIKIKVNKDDLTCTFLKDGGMCVIYDTRPSECRAFKCWDSREIEMKYDEDPLERADLLSDVEGLWDLITDHQERCSYARMKELTERLKDDKTGEVLAAINEIIAFDLSLRDTLVEKAKINPDMLPFLLGRPFTETMAMFNLKIVEKDEGYVLDHV
jgi:Fe-S-cluster containining protein